MPSNIPFNINLFDLFTTDSQEFLITFKDTNFLIVPDALIDITRKYISEGVFKTVEVPKTDSLGQTIGHFVLSDVIYTIIVRKHNEILAIFENVQVVCQDLSTGDCRLNLNAGGQGTFPQDFNTIANVSFSLDYDETTRILTAIFSATDGVASLYNLTARTELNNTFVCQNSVTSSSGSISCTVPSTFNKILISGKLYKGNTFLGEIFFFVTDQNIPTAFGSTGYILISFLIIILVMMAISDRIIMVIMALIGVIIATILNIYTGGTVLGAGSIIIWLFVAGFILIWKIERVLR